MYRESLSTYLDAILSESNTNPINKSSPVHRGLVQFYIRDGPNWTGFAEMDSNWIPIILRLKDSLPISTRSSTIYLLTRST
jgi:hypothetical protein